MLLQVLGLQGAFTGQVGGQRGTGALHLGFEAADDLVEVLLLLLAHALAGEFGAIQVGLRREAPGALDELGDGFAGLGLVDAGRGDFAFDAHDAGLLGHGQAQVGAVHDGDHVVSLQLQVVGGVFVDDGLGQVEGDQLGAQFGLVQALDDGVFPVDLLGKTTDTVDGVAGLPLFFADLLQLLLAQGRRAGGGDAAGTGTGASYRLGHGLAKLRAAGDDFGGQGDVVGQLLGTLQGLDLLGREALGAQGGDAVLHQLVAALVEVGADEGFAVGDQVGHAHARIPAVAERLGHRALQGHRVAKGGADGQEGDDVAVAQGLAEALGVEHQVLHAAGGAGLLGVDALDQGLLLAGQGRHAAADGQQVLHGGAVLELVDGAQVGGAGQGHARAGGRDGDHVAGLQQRVAALVTLGDEVVQVERGDGLAAAAQGDLAQTAVGVGAAAGKHGIHQGGQAGEVVGAGLAGLAHHIDGHAAQPAQAGVDGDVGEDGGHLFAHRGFEVLDLHAAEVERADFGQADLAVAVDRLVACKVNGARDGHAHLVAGAEHVFAGGGHGAVGGVGLRVVKQVGTKNGQQLAGAFLHKTLELAGGQGLGCAQRRLWDAAGRIGRAKVGALGQLGHQIGAWLLQPRLL